jgi:hypothetical protein
MTKESALERSNQLGQLLNVERRSMLAFILALVEFDSQQGWKALGYTSLWGYLSRELKMSDAMVATRAAAVQLVRRFPQIGDLLRDGKLCVTAMPRLATILTQENCEDVWQRQSASRSATSIGSWRRLLPNQSGKKSFRNSNYERSQ